ncbi:MAG: hypothetical protein J6A61_03420 [Clostridia bacterium]|nr:hypothetical protein [Clostridia bacterium]
MKQKFLCLVCILMCLCTVSSYAAPASISSKDYGASGLITVTNPGKNYSTTYNKTITLSGYATAHSTVYVYVFDGSSYKPYYQNGVALSVSVGASGIFAIPVNLSSGTNLFLLRAESGGSYQNTTFEVNVLSSAMFGLIDRLKSLTFGLK